MNSNLKNKINSVLKNLKSIEIINSNDFYFQKAKDALDNYLLFEVKDEIKEFLLSNKRNYKQLKQLFEDSEDFTEFGSKVFTIISYCDSNAHKKKQFNGYEDNRVLALAFVRMNNWVEQLITYKFEGVISDGSIKNAIDYLINPLENFTMLSENHRMQISQNLFKKNYNSFTFKDDFINFFAEFSISINNPQNFTYLLSRIAYGIDSEWKDNIIGLVCPDTTGWQENAIKDSQNGNHIALWNHKKPNGTSSTLKLLRECIEENGYFRIFYTASYKVIYVAEIIDFVCDQYELNKAEWLKNYGAIEWYNDIFSNYNDGSKTARWVYLARKIIKVNYDDYLDFQYYKSNNYPSVGCQSPVVSYKNSLMINQESKMNKNIELLKYKKQIILQGPPGTGKTREAKLIAQEMLGLNTVENLNDNEQFKIIQFHPSYTYEDFVRGIVAKPNSDGEGILYEAENKTLGAFAKRAFENFIDSNKDVVAITREVKVKELFENFVEYLNDEIEKANGFYSLTDNVGLISSDDEYAFRYKGIKDGWLKNGNRILFKDILQSYFAGDSVRKHIKNNQKISGLARQHASYFIRVLNLFQKYIENENLENNEIELDQKIDQKNYVLIIDEINRANLSSVLGELIYALEYRGESVDSMYDVEGKELILPQNLYIIGTMNTADRSVGHIDYAIRRRFAFVNVLPKDLSDDEDVVFDSKLFSSVKALFTTDDYKTHSDNLSKEFEPKDVVLGHSYFIQQYEKDEKGREDKTKPIDFQMRLDYEIKPILLEYVKDGILIGKDITDKIEQLEISI